MFHCDTRWTNEHAGREELVANTLMYYLVRSLQPAATIDNIKSVDKLRQALQQIKMEDESSTTLKDLLEQCVIRPNYLKQDKVRTTHILYTFLVLKGRYNVTNIGKNAFAIIQPTWKFIALCH